MSLRRSLCAVAAAAAIGMCAVGATVATADDDSSDQSGGDSGGKPPRADGIALDPLGDADRGVDIQSLAVFNRSDLDFVALSITGRDFRIPTTRSVEIYLDTTPGTKKPNHRIVAHHSPGAEPSRVRMYRTKGWSTAGQKRIDCDELQVQFDIENQSQIRMAVPRTCLRSAKGDLSANASVWGRHPVLWGDQPDPDQDTDVAPDEDVLTPAT